MTFDPDAYLRRIGLDACPATAAGLAALQAAQLQTIAFESIDPFLGQVPDISEEALWEKLVLRGRGGYCFELNTLLGIALKSFGFVHEPVLARVRSPAFPDGGARTHYAFLVEVDGEEWLVDAGFCGPCPPLPLRTAPGREQQVGRASFRIVRQDAEEVVERRTGGPWVALYGFERGRVTAADIEAANFVAGAWPRAPFPNNLILARQTPEGRLSQLNRMLRLEAADEISSLVIESEAELAAALRDRFGLVVDDATCARVWQRIAEAAPGG